MAEEPKPAKPEQFLSPPAKSSQATVSHLQLAPHPTEVMNSKASIDKQLKDCLQRNALLREDLTNYHMNPGQRYTLKQSQFAVPVDQQQLFP